MTRREYEGRTELRKAGLHRLAEAEALRDAGAAHTLCAKYLAGYAVECGLKTIAMEVFGVWTLTELADRLGVGEDDLFHHGLEALASNLPFFGKMQKSEIWRDFTYVNQWRPSWRYSPVRSSRDAQAFIEAVKKVRRWLDVNRA